MSGQRKISSFFSPAQIKRPISSIGNNKSQSPSPKKLKDDENAKSPSPNKPKDEMKMGKGLSPEQRQRMEERRREALKILQCKGVSATQVNSPCVKSPSLVNSSVKNAPVGFSPSWAKALSAEFSKPYFVKLQEFVEAERGRCTVYPPRDQVFTWTQMSHIRDVKVVILGQDPYHGPGQAHGLCFSVPHGIRPPPSLVNMYKCLEKDIEGFQNPGHGNLTQWAKQGVLLLNAVLTVRANNANSHKDKGWETFTTAVISWLNSNLSGVVFMLWGSYAQKKCSFINAKRHHILKSVHPSPLSAHRGFFECAHFSKTNELLKKSGKKPIDWNQLSNEN